MNSIEAPIADIIEAATFWQKESAYDYKMKVHCRLYGDISPWHGFSYFDDRGNDSSQRARNFLFSIIGNGSNE